MKPVWVTLLVLLVIVLAICLHGRPRADHNLTTVWHWGVEPGLLSAKHASFEQNCLSCHTPLMGVSSIACVQCHASNQNLLKRQPTAFHAEIKDCTGCHIEHQGREAVLTKMNHEALAGISLKTLEKSSKEGNMENLSRLLKEIHATQPLAGHKEVQMLNCSACHDNQDRHRGFFGKDCLECHSTDRWTIDTFRHPSPRSRDCVQCHQAPPSHYMEHFHMVSMQVAHVEHAEVSQCYLCHQTTAWNDIKGVGWYKHH